MTFCYILIEMANFIVTDEKSTILTKCPTFYWRKIRLPNENFTGMCTTISHTFGPWQSCWKQPALSIHSVKCIRMRKKFQVTKKTFFIPIHRQHMVNKGESVHVLSRVQRATGTPGPHWLHFLQIGKTFTREKLHLSGSIRSKWRLD